MSFASTILAIALAALIPPPVPPDSGLATPPQRPSPEPAPSDKDKEKDAGPDPAYMTLLPDDGSAWGLSPELATRLAGVAEKYLNYAVKFTCTETVRKARFDDGEHVGLACRHIHLDE